MFENDYTFKIIIVVGLLVLIFMFLSQRNQENFSSSEQELNRYYEGNTQGIENDLVDNMTCSPSCCGGQWPVPFDGLTPTEIHKCIQTDNESGGGPFVRTNMTCGNGIGGVGCPCISKDAYKFLVNRGENSPTLRGVDPTLLIRNDEVQPHDMQTSSHADSNWYQMSPAEQIQSRKSMFVDSAKLTDLQRGPPLADLRHLNSLPAGAR